MKLNKERKAQEQAELMKQGVQDAQKNYQFANAKKNEQLYNHVSNKIEHSQ